MRLRKVISLCGQIHLNVYMFWNDMKFILVALSCSTHVCSTGLMIHFSDFFFIAACSLQIKVFSYLLISFVTLFLEWVFSNLFKKLTWKKLKQAARRHSWKSVFLKILYSSQETPVLQYWRLKAFNFIKKETHRWFPVNIAKFWRKGFYWNITC